MESNLLGRLKVQSETRVVATVKDYIAITRLDHSTKHIFVIPGAVIAFLLRGTEARSLVLSIVLGLFACICIASANYAINEFLDRDFDRFHPTKSHRAAVQHALDGRIVFLEWLTLITLGLTAAYAANTTLLFVATIFALQGVVYNAPPLRTKDRPYLDVLSESINNPLRLMIGWSMVDSTTLPPVSIILSYWLGGAFLMTAKRYSEYREIVASHGRELLVRYRVSFETYSEVSLNTSCFIYGLLSTFFLGIFLVKYRVEYLLLMPVIILLFGYYMALAMRPQSPAQHPEKLFRERKLMLLVGLLSALFLVSTWVDIPTLSVFSRQQYIMLPSK